MPNSDQSLRLLLDTPEPDASFHFGQYAKVLTVAITNSDPHFTIGIFGPWGKGKTTLLNLLKKELENHSISIVVVPFDAWRYQHESHMVVAMLNTLEVALRTNKGALKHVGEAACKLARAFAYSTTVTAGYAQIDLAKGLAKLEKEAKSNYEWNKVLNEALAEARRRDPSARIVFLIDDLDRCLPNKAVEVLEAIKVILDVDGFVFVLALDRDIIKNAVEAHYGKDYQIKGDEYIKKLVQVEFALPPLRSQDLQEYLKTLQQKLPGLDSNMAKALKEVVPEIARGNPREVKRFINSTLIANAIAAEAHLDVPPVAQVAFMGIRFIWPGFAEELREHTGIADSTTKFLAQDSSANRDAMNAIKAMLDKYPGLESFLRMPASGKLLKLPSNQLEQIIFFAGRVGRQLDVEVSDGMRLGDEAKVVVGSVDRMVSSGTGTSASSMDLENFSEPARRVLTFAKEETQRLNHSFIGTEHLLLGLIREHDGIAAKVLTALGIDLDKARSTIEFIIGRGLRPVSAELAFTPRAKRVIELAVDEAHRLDDSSVATEHLLLGLVREGQGVAVGVLESLGAKAHLVRAETLRMRVLPTVGEGDTVVVEGKELLGPSAGVAKELEIERSKVLAQQRLDEDTKRVGRVRGELHQLPDRTWAIKWGGNYRL